ncbi:MAG TPA: serine protease [Blastocatellia bacterium]|nr:serine protease [Blastocatellia bacterium]
MRGLRTGFGLALLVIWYRPEAGTRLPKPDFVSSARARFVLVTSDCLLGSGFLTGHRENGKAEVVTAYHLVTCGHGKTKHQSKSVQVDGVTAEIRGADPHQDLLRLLVPLRFNAGKIAMRTESSLGEPVFAVGSNPKGDRSVVTWGNVLMTPPGEVTAKVPIVPGTSGGQLISAVDGALLGVAVREEFGFTNAVNSNTLLQFLERTRKR